MRRIFRHLPSDSRRAPCALAIGNFDGVHLGHRKLLAGVVEAARTRSLVPAVVTFEPHPREYFGSENLTRVIPLRDKIDRLFANGIERVYVLPFDQMMAEMSPEDFARSFLYEKLACRWVTVGENFRFGANRAGDFARLFALGREMGYEAVCARLIATDGQVVSSSRIRRAIDRGDIAGAAAMLGHPLTISGHVVHGAKLGRTIGFPTLNLSMHTPGSKAHCSLHGVYAVRVHGLADTPLAAVTSVGIKPTVTNAKKWLAETHVFDWKGDAYGRLVTLEVVAKLRDEKKFGSLDELTQAIGHDALVARQLLGHSRL
ncbi:MAG: bifunctional riboflavin kinase/FAD synthetase [Duodenibacillus sp.]